MSSSIDPAIPPLKPHYAPPQPGSARKESATLQSLIDHLHLQPHIEGGYFVETDRDATQVPNPFQSSSSHDGPQENTSPSPSAETTTFFTDTGSVSADLSDKYNPSDKEAVSHSHHHDVQTHNTQDGSGNNDDNDSYRNASTSIHYLLTPSTPLGSFHRNRGRTIHTLHRGRGRYVIIHADEVMPSYEHDNGEATGMGVRLGEGTAGGEGHGAGGGEKARIETFVVGQNVERGERLQWIVPGGKYKVRFFFPFLARFCVRSTVCLDSDCLCCRLVSCCRWKRERKGEMERRRAC